MRFFAALVLFLSVGLPLDAAVLQGRVVRVADGDTVTVLDATKTQHKVRLSGIDAPEKSQAFGTASRKHLAGMVADRNVRVVWEKRDKYGRILGVVYFDEVNVNLKMVADGLAWHFKRFDNTPAFAQAEKEAKAKKVGLWKEANPIPPWDYRKAKRENGNPLGQ